MGIPSGIGEMKTKFWRVAFEPTKGSGSRKRSSQFQVSGCAEIERAARVMLTASWHGIYAENVTDRFPAYELSADDGCLP
jgi:hypothetical protein